MSVSNRLKNQHLLWRAAFGPMAENAASLDTISQKKLWALLVKTSSKPVQKLEVTKNPADEYMNGMTDPKEMQKAMNNQELRKKLREQSRDDLKNSEPALAGNHDQQRSPVKGKNEPVLAWAFCLP